MSPYDGQYFHFASGRNYIVSLLSYAVPEWRNGRRRGFKIPRPQGRVSSSLTLGTIFAAKNYYKRQKILIFWKINLVMIFLFSISDTFALFFIDYQKYLVTVRILNVGSVRRGGTKGWCCCVSLFSFHLNFSNFITKKTRYTTFCIHSRLVLNIVVSIRYHLH